jgi:hypothetical protein
LKTIGATALQQIAAIHFIPEITPSRTLVDPAVPSERRDLLAVLQQRPATPARAPARICYFSFTFRGSQAYRRTAHRDQTAKRLMEWFGASWSNGDVTREVLPLSTGMVE